MSKAFPITEKLNGTQSTVEVAGCTSCPFCVHDGEMGDDCQLDDRGAHGSHSVAGLRQYDEDAKMKASWRPDWCALERRRDGITVTLSSAARAACF